MAALFGTRHSLAVRIAPLALFFIFIFVLAPLPLLAQAQPAAKAVETTAAAPAKAALSWADEVLRKESYATPPEDLAKAVLAPRYLNVTLTELSPDKKWFLDEIADGPVPMSVFSKPFHELGGLFVDFKANRARPLTIRNSVGIQILSAADGARKVVQLPAGARVSNATWSPDSASIGFFVHTEDATHIWVADVATGKARQVTRTPVLATLNTAFEFTPDSRQILTVLVPDGRGPMPTGSVAPAGPAVKLAETREKARLRTFPSLMSTPYELQLFEWHGTGQLALIDLPPAAAKEAKARSAKDAARGVKKVGAPAMIQRVGLSPDGKYVRVTRLVKPFSYIVPVSSFGTVDEVWDADGKMLAKVNDRPLNLGTQDDNAPAPDPAAGPGGQGQQGRREMAWRADSQGLTFLEQDLPPVADLTPGAGRGPAVGGAGRGGQRGGAAAAGGDDEQGDRAQGPRRKDRVWQWKPPFGKDDMVTVFESNTRMSNHRFSPDMKTLFFSERSGQNTVECAVALAEPAKRYTLARYRSDDVYANPGTLVMTTGAAGGGRGGAPAAGGRGGAGGPGGGIVQLSADGNSVFFQGTLHDKNPQDVGTKTFVDRVAIKTGEKKRIWESNNDNVYERITAILDVEAGRFVVARESATEVTQSYLLDGGRRTQLTKNEDYTPDLSKAPRERFVVERPDGFKFRVNVTLPPGYQKGTRLPAIFWFYPREYAGQEEYDRGARTFNKNEFPAFGTRSMQYFVRLGYAVVEPDAPIVGPAGQMNNNYEHDLRNNLAAVIDHLEARGLIDRGRLAIGGHSYGAFSTVNAMVHTPFFKAGIAGDGAYNRTLTPLGFQSERRDLWQARDVYLSMSPFLFADDLTGALLMYHGLGDQNVGTDPTNSTRLFHALNGLGKTTALYLYPLEDHGPAAKETLLDLWARWAAWLDKYVKNPQKAAPAPPKAE
jgi:dipeptidyl aminopeptidase/acylaminoacyl peptidase